MNFCNKCVHHEVDERYRWSTEIHRCNHVRDQKVVWLVDENQTEILTRISCHEYRYGLKETDWRMVGKELCGIEGKFFKQKLDSVEN